MAIRSCLLRRTVSRKRFTYRLYLSPGLFRHFFLSSHTASALASQSPRLTRPLYGTFQVSPIHPCMFTSLAVVQGAFCHLVNLVSIRTTCRNYTRKITSLLSCSLFPESLLTLLLQVTISPPSCYCQPPLVPVLNDPCKYTLQPQILVIFSGYSLQGLPLLETLLVVLVHPVTVVAPLSCILSRCARRWRGLILSCPSTRRDTAHD